MQSAKDKLVNVENRTENSSYNASNIFAGIEKSIQIIATGIRKACEGKCPLNTTKKDNTSLIQQLESVQKDSENSKEVNKVS